MNPPNAPPQPAPSPTPTPSNLTPDIVSNIPVKAPAGPGAASFNDEAELDKIMQDVGHELKKEDSKPRKKGFLGFKSKPKSEPRLAQPPTLNRPPTASTPAPKINPEPAAKTPAVPAAAKTKPAKTDSAPVLVITFAIAITAALIAVAVYAYKK